MSRLLDCPVCGHHFDAELQAACRSCPLERGCNLVCCPECGHVTVDPGRSRLARWVGSIVNRWRPGDGVLRTLADVPPGHPVEVRSFRPGLEVGQRQHLLAYGVTPGEQVTVLQQAPVTVLRVGHTELAVEADVARLVEVGVGGTDRS